MRPTWPEELGEAAGELRRGGVEQQARALQRIARDCDDARLLPLQLVVRVEIGHARDLARGVVLDLRDMRLRTNFHVPRFLALGNLGVERRPFRAPFAALEAEAGLPAGDAMVARGGVDRHPTRVTLLVAELVGAGLEDLEIVASRQARPIARAGDAHLVFGLGVIGLELG